MALILMEGSLSRCFSSLLDVGGESSLSAGFVIVVGILGKLEVKISLSWFGDKVDTGGRWCMGERGILGGGW